MNAKIIIAIIISSIVIAAALVIKKKFFGNEPAKGVVKKTSLKKSQKVGVDDAIEELSTQEILPVADIRGPVLLQRDGTAICYVKVSCRNTSLLNLKELVAEASTLAPCLASQTTPFKVLHIQRPVDSSANLARLEACDEHYLKMLASCMGEAMSFRDRQARKQLDKRRWLLAHYKRHAELEVKQTAKTIAEAYICLPVRYSVGNEEMAYQLACDMRERLKASGYMSKVLWAEEIVSMCLAYQSAYRSSNENTSPYITSPLINGYDYEAMLVNPAEEEQDRDYAV